MERLKKIINDLRSGITSIPEEALLHHAREYLQILILKILFQSREELGDGGQEKMVTEKL